MSLLETLEEGLKTNPEISLVKYFKGYYSLDDGHKPDFWIAPKQGEYTTKGINNFMEKIKIPEFNPQVITSFIIKPEKRLVFGKLFYREKIGISKKSGKSIYELEDNTFCDKNFKNGKFETSWNAEENYMRSILVVVCPDEIIAKERLDNHKFTEDGKYTYSISLKDLKKYAKK